MSDEFEEDDDLAALKRWWAKNGSSLLLGGALGISCLGGWSYWQDKQIQSAHQASSAFLLAQNALQEGDSEAFESRAASILAEFPDSGYALGTQLLQAKYLVEKGELASAESTLEAASLSATAQPYAELISLRLGRVKAELGKTAEAQELLRQLIGTEMEAYAREALGDIARRQGDSATARQEYTASIRLAAPNQRLVQFKQDDLPSTP